jgi:hypothetical protein
MADDKHYVPGSFYRICDITGFKVRAERTRKMWSGTIRRIASWEARQPQDFVKGVKDDQAVPDPRPRQVDRFINQDAGTGQFQVYGDQADVYGAEFLVQNNQGPAYDTGLFSNYNNNGTAEMQELNGTVPAVTAASLNQSMNRGPGDSE